MLVMVLTIAAVILAVAAKFVASVAAIKAVTLFLGLEGTALLASALFPPRMDSNHYLLVFELETQLDGNILRFNSIQFSLRPRALC